jgi:hypothetical protein
MEMTEAAVATALGNSLGRRGTSIREFWTWMLLGHDPSSACRWPRPRSTKPATSDSTTGSLRVRVSSHRCSAAE